ncbi:MAG: hypothetical protein L6Q83_10210, partial [Gammaproteobacteria bacterium]|nr:hypothetical protein [Gammaproteobacteria bacterium]
MMTLLFTWEGPGLRRALVISPLLATALIMPASAEAPLSFGEPLAVSATNGAALSPDIALGADGVLHVLYVEKADKANAAGGARDHAAGDDLYYRRALPGLSSLGPPVRVNSTAGEIWGFAVSKPELSVGGDGTLHVFYSGNALQAGTGKNILVARYTRS